MGGLNELKFLRHQGFEFELDYVYQGEEDAPFGFTSKYKLNHGVNRDSTYLVFEFDLSGDSYGNLSVSRQNKEGRELMTVSSYPDLSKNYRKDFKQVESYVIVLKTIINYYKKNLK